MYRDQGPKWLTCDSVNLGCNQMLELVLFQLLEKEIKKYQHNIQLLTLFISIITDFYLPLIGNVSVAIDNGVIKWQLSERLLVVKAIFNIFVVL